MISIDMFRSIYPANAASLFFYQHSLGPAADGSIVLHASDSRAVEGRLMRPVLACTAVPFSVTSGLGARDITGTDKMRDPSTHSATFSSTIFIHTHHRVP